MGRWTLASWLDRAVNLERLINHYKYSNLYFPEDVQKSRDQMVEVAKAKWLDCYPDWEREIDIARRNGYEITGNWIRKTCSRWGSGYEEAVPGYSCDSMY